MKKCLLLILILISIRIAVGQEESIRLSFTALNNTRHIALDSIKIWNISEQCDSTLNGGDTILSVGVLDINEFEQSLSNKMRVYQVSPNPFEYETKINIDVPASGWLQVSVSDIFGSLIARAERLVIPGIHSFTFISGNPGLYILSAKCKNSVQSVKMISTGSALINKSCLQYSQGNNNIPSIKSSINGENFHYSYGNQLVFIGYYNGQQSGILGKPLGNADYSFQFASNIPCPGALSLSYEGKTYETVQIFSQCWMSENLNVGVMVLGTDTLKNNNIIEKYCYGNSEVNCATYGGLYQKDEILQYSTIEGTRGICPEGWHVPSKADWSILMGVTDSFYGIDNPIWWGHEWAFLGLDIGKNLKSTTGWQGMNGINKFGFNILPVGERDLDGGFLNLNYSTSYITSSQADDPLTSNWHHGFYYNSDQIWQGITGSDEGLPCRCVKDQ